MNHVNLLKINFIAENYIDCNSASIHFCQICTINLGYMGHKEQMILSPIYDFPSNRKKSHFWDQEVSFIPVSLIYEVYCVLYDQIVKIQLSVFR